VAEALDIGRAGLLLLVGALMREVAGRSRDAQLSERPKVFAHDLCSFRLGPLRRAGTAKCRSFDRL